jgi:hypothetical protein
MSEQHLRDKFYTMEINEALMAKRGPNMDEIE